MKKIILFYLFSFICFPIIIDAQRENTLSPPDWNLLMRLPNANYYTIRKQVTDFFAIHPSTQNEFKEEDEGDRLSYMNFLRWDNFWSTRVATGDQKTNGTFNKLFQAYSTTAQTQICTASGPYMSSWQLLGPVDMPNQNMGLIDALKQHPTNANIIYAGTNNSGLWKTIDGGVNWVCKTDVLRYPGMGIMDVQIDQTNPNTIYIATGSRSGFGAGLFKSIDGGNSWLTTSLSYSPSNSTIVTRIRIDPTNSNILYAITNYDVWRSTDAGLNWVSIRTITPNFWMPLNLADIEILPANPNVLFVSELNPGVGNTGTSAMGKLELVGSSWIFTSLTPAPVIAGSIIERLEMAISPITPNVIYVVYDEVDPTLTSSPTYHNTYDNTSSSWSMPAVNSVGIGYFDYQFEVSPTDPNVMYMGTSIGYKSINGGTSWSAITAYNGPTTHADVRAIRIISGSTIGTGGVNDKVYIGTDGGVSKSTNGGTTWANINGTGLAIIQFFGIGNSDAVPNIIPGGAQDNGAYTYNYGTWSLQIVGDGYDCEVDKVDPKYMYMAANGGYNYLVRSTNSGTSWGSMGQPSGPCLTTRPIQMNSIDNKLYVGYHDVFECANPRATSVTWTALSNFSASGTPANDVIRGFAVAPSDPNVIYASFNRKVWGGPINGLFYKTTNHGATWTDIGINIGALAWWTITDIAVDQYNTSRLWVTLDGLSAAGATKVLFSNDGGATWSDFSTGLPDIPMNTIVFEKGTNDGLYVGTDIGVFYRNGTMSQWECFNHNLPICLVYDLEINYGRNTLRAGTFGRGIWESNLACPQSYDLILSGPTSTSAFNEAQNKIYSTQQISGGNISYRGGQSVELNPGFSASTSGYFSAYIHPCDVNGNSPLATRGTTIITEDETESDESKVQMPSTSENSINVYPNPSEGKFTVDLGADNKRSTVVVYNLMGVMVANYPNVTNTLLEIDISALAKGIYTVKSFDEDGVKNAIIICK
jgi:Secretion system C-terminal sorting domain